MSQFIQIIKLIDEYFIMRLASPLSLLTLWLIKVCLGNILDFGNF